MVFTSTSGALSARKAAGLAGVFVRDLAAGTTTLLSDHRPGGGAPLRAGAASVDLGATPAFGRPADHAGLICARES